MLSKKRFKIRLSEAQNWRCAYCAVEMTVMYCASDVDRKGRNLGRQFTIDEVIPRGRGGPRSWDNQVAACKMCNDGRGMIDALVYVAKVIELGRRRAAAWGRSEHARLDKERAAVARNSSPIPPSLEIVR